MLSAAKHLAAHAERPFAALGRPAKKEAHSNKHVPFTLYYIFWMMTSLKLSCKLIVTNQKEYRGRSPLPGFGVSPRSEVL
jgi:hypothetical protein